MKENLTNNLGTKIMSLLLAAVVWLVIVNIDDPYRVRNFDVPVEMINEDAIVSVNKVYEVIEGSEARVTVRGKRSVIDKLGASDIRATADLGALSDVNAVTIKATLIKEVSYEPELECNTVLKVSLEERKSKQVKVDVVTAGEPENGYSIGECKAKPNMVEISGGRSKVDSVDRIRVRLDVTGASEKVTKKLVPVALDKDGERIDSNSLTFNQETIRVTAEILPIKTIPVEVQITGKAAENYEYVGIDCLPEEVRIAAQPEDLENITKIVIPIDIEGYTSNTANLERDFNTADYLPSGVKVLEGFDVVSIRINIKPIIEKQVTLASSDIAIHNLKSRFSVTMLSENVTVTLKGLEEELEKIKSNSLGAFVDLTGYKAGTEIVPIQFSLPEGIGLVSDVNIRIEIRKKENTEDNQQGTPTPGAPSSTPTAVPTDTPEEVLPAMGDGEAEEE